jgi:hypothetical protein
MSQIEPLSQVRCKVSSPFVPVPATAPSPTLFEIWVRAIPLPSLGAGEEHPAHLCYVGSLTHIRARFIPQLSDSWPDPRHRSSDHFCIRGLLDASQSTVLVTSTQEERAQWALLFWGISFGPCYLRRPPSRRAPPDRSRGAQEGDPAPPRGSRTAYSGVLGSPPILPCTSEVRPSALRAAGPCRTIRSVMRG